MKPIWVVLMVVVLVALSFIVGRSTAPPPKETVRDSLAVLWDTLPPPPPVIRWKTIPVPDTGRIQHLLRTIQDKDSLIATLAEYRRIEGTWEQQYLHAVQDTIFKIPVRGRFAFSDNHLDAPEVAVSVDTLVLPSLVRTIETTAVVEKGLDLFTLGGIGLGCILTGYVVHDIIHNK